MFSLWFLAASNKNYNPNFGVTVESQKVNAVQETNYSKDIFLDVSYLHSSASPPLMLYFKM